MRFFFFLQIIGIFLINFMQTLTSITILNEDRSIRQIRKTLTLHILSKLFLILYPLLLTLGLWQWVMEDPDPFAIIMSTGLSIFIGLLLYFMLIHFPDIFVISLMGYGYDQVIQRVQEQLTDKDIPNQVKPYKTSFLSGHVVGYECRQKRQRIWFEIADPDLTMLHFRSWQQCTWFFAEVLPTLLEEKPVIDEKKLHKQKKLHIIMLCVFLILLIFMIVLYVTYFGVTDWQNRDIVGLIQHLPALWRL